MEIGIFTLTYMYFFSTMLALFNVKKRWHVATVRRGVELLETIQETLQHRMVGVWKRLKKIIVVQKGKFNFLLFLFLMYAY